MPFERDISRIKLPSFVTGGVVVAPKNEPPRHRPYRLELLRFSRGRLIQRRPLHTFTERVTGLQISPSARYLLWNDARITDTVTHKSIHASRGFSTGVLVSWSPSGDAALFHDPWRTNRHYIVHAPSGMVATVPNPGNPIRFRALASFWTAPAAPNDLGRVVVVYAVPGDAASSILDHWQLKRPHDVNKPTSAWQLGFAVHDVAVRGILKVAPLKPIPAASFDALIGRSVRSRLMVWLRDVLSHVKLHDTRPGLFTVASERAGSGVRSPSERRVFFHESDYDSPQGTGLYADSLVYYAAVGNKEYQRSYRLQTLSSGTWSSVEAHRIHFLDNHDTPVWVWLDVRNGEFYGIDELSEWFTPRHLIP
jgi:hypothetical protein